MTTNATSRMFHKHPATPATAASVAAISMQVDHRSHSMDSYGTDTRVRTRVGEHMLPACIATMATQPATICPPAALFENRIQTARHVRLTVFDCVVVHFLANEILVTQSTVVNLDSR